MKHLFSLGVAALFALSLVVSKPLDLSAKMARMGEGVVTNPVTSPISSAISGSIKVVSAPLSGIKVVLLKLLPRESKVAEVMTDENGNYSFETLPNGDYKVMPRDRNYTFSPVFQVVSVTNNQVTGVDFQATSN